MGIELRKRDSRAAKVIRSVEKKHEENRTVTLEANERGEGRGGLGTAATIRILTISSRLVPRNHAIRYSGRMFRNRAEKTPA
jgi:hypothetical protein